MSKYERFFTIGLLCLLAYSCTSPNEPEAAISYAAPTPPENVLEAYPPLITPVEDYYLTRIADVPELDANTYSLTVWGLGDSAIVFSYDDLLALSMQEYPLTIQCVGNSPQDTLISSANWRGFNLYDLLKDYGMSESAGGVKYTCADGYYASHTLAQIRDNAVIGALYMNDDVLTPVQGFPLRIINPGYYGVKQPAWVTSIEILSPMEIASHFNDFWAVFGYDVEPLMPVESKYFFPESEATISVGQTLPLGGAGYGAGRIEKVELTTDGGANWHQTVIVDSVNADHVWIFWYGEITFPTAGEYQVYARATDKNGVQQSLNFSIYGDPVVLVSVQ